MMRLRTDPLWRAIPLLEVDWRRVITAIGLGSLALGSAVGLAAVSAWLIARASQMPPVLHLSVAVVAVRAFGISRGVFRYLERLASHDIALRGMSALRANVYRALAQDNSPTLMSLRRGDLLARVGADVDSVGDAVVRSMVPMGVAIVVSTGSAILVGAFLPSAGLAVTCCLLLAGVVTPWLAARAARSTEERGAQVRGQIAGTTLEVLEAAGPLAVSGQLKDRLGSLHALDHSWIRLTRDGARIDALAAGLLNLCLGLAVLASLRLGIPAVESGALAPVELSVIVLAPLAMFEAVGALPAAAVQWRRSSHAARRILDLVPDHEDVRHFSPAPRPAALGSLDDGVLDATEISCAWPTSPGPVLDGATLRMVPGRSIAVVGSSGVGKTTLLMTLAGLLPAVHGSVRLSGVPVSDLTHDELTAQITYVAEDEHIFETTVLENLRVARRDVDETEARQVLADVGLDTWLAALPSGLNTILGPNATTISGGERRRIVIARSLLTPARFVLVDEPVEHVDGPGADELIARLVENCRSGRGLVVATHRLSALRLVDEVIVLERGDHGPARIAARGSHAELLTVPAYRWALEQEAADEHPPDQ